MFEALVTTFKKLNPEQLFKNVVGHGELKELIWRGVYSEHRTATLLTGPPGTAKSLFMLEVCKRVKNWHYFDGSTMSGKGLIEFMYNHQNAEGICIDEIDKLNRAQQATLYNFLQTGEIRYETSKLKLHFKMEKCKVLATSNSIEKLTKPLQSRFGVPYNIPPYTFEEFTEISRRLLAEEFKIQEDVSVSIANVAWNEMNCRDVRVLQHIGSRIRKDDRADDIERIVKSLIKYGQLQVGQSGEYN